MSRMTSEARARTRDYAASAREATRNHPGNYQPPPAEHPLARQQRRLLERLFGDRADAAEARIAELLAEKLAALANSESQEGSGEQVVQR